MNRSVKIAGMSAALATASLLLLACDPPPDPTDPRVPQGGVQQLSADTVTAVSAEQGKPGAPVEVSYEVSGTPLVGQVTEIELKFDTSISEAPVYVSYVPVDDSAINLVDTPPGKVPVSMQAEGRGRAGRDQLRVIPQREGRHFVTVLVEVETENGPMTRSVSVPVEVAGIGAKLQAPSQSEPQQPPVETDANGEAVISMPARER
ncbi:hypothetical protein F6455_15830 [Proteobacteria bacterium 005FR1]|nr:hypothetical protein [Proteobacteria bacterium 005FR1]